MQCDRLMLMVGLSFLTFLRWLTCDYPSLTDRRRNAHADGCFIVFLPLPLTHVRLEAFYDNPNALRDYFRDIGRMVLAAEGRNANDSHADCYQYFCVPEYGTANGRLH